MTSEPDPQQQAMEAEIAAALDARLHAPGLDDGRLLERVKNRVMAAVREDARPSYRTVRATDAEGWQPMAPGVDRKLLWDTHGARSVMLRCAPGATVPPHIHGMDEECIVLEGTLKIGDALILHAGDFHVGRRGSAHEVAFTDTGALVYLRGAIDEV